MSAYEFHIVIVTLLSASSILIQYVKYSDVSVSNREVRVRLVNTLLEVSRVIPPSKKPFGP